MRVLSVRWAMRITTLNMMLCALLGSYSAWAGLITSATAEASGIGYPQQNCTTGTTAGAVAACSASAGTRAAADSEATASFESVSAFVEGGASGFGYGSWASAASSFSETFTVFSGGAGGTTTGVLAIIESSLTSDTGSLSPRATAIPIPKRRLSIRPSPMACRLL